jgi:hypothetical protein
VPSQPMGRARPPSAAENGATPYQLMAISRRSASSWWSVHLIGFDQITNESDPPEEGVAKSGAALKITNINEPVKRCTQWWRIASAGTEKYQWFYEPRLWLHMRRQEPLISKWWMNIDPPHGARRAALKAIREALSRIERGQS